MPGPPGMVMQAGGPSPLRAALERDGFVVAPLLTAAEVETLVDAYRRLHTERDFGCQVSTVSPDAGYRHAAAAAVRSIVEPAVLARFPKQRWITSGFVAKEPGPATDMVLHQDWPTCDEERWTPIQVWVALTPTARSNGGLVVFPGTHRDSRLRGSGLPILAPRFADLDPREGVALEVEAGEAVVYHPALVHGSGPNQGGALRLAAVSAFQPLGAELVHHKLLEDGTIGTFSVDPDFFLSRPEPTDPPPGPRIEVAP